MVTSKVQEPGGGNLDSSRTVRRERQKSEREKEGEKKKEVGAEKREQVRKSDLLNVGLENVSQKGSTPIRCSGSAALSFLFFLPFLYVMYIYGMFYIFSKLYGARTFFLK